MRKLFQLIILNFVLSAFLFLSLHVFMNKPIIPALLDSLLSVTSLIPFGIGLVYQTRYMIFEAINIPKISFNNLITAIIISIASVYLTFFLLIFFLSSSHKPYIGFFESTISFRIFASVTGCLIFTSFIYTRLFYIKSLQSLKTETELNARLREARLDSLKFQLNPHFLFNSLNSIASLTISSPQSARIMTIKLAGLLRKTMKKDTIFSALYEELESAESYLEIEKVRFGERLTLGKTIDQEMGEINIPSMILQPLLENAVKFGVGSTSENIMVSLSVKKKDSYINIVISNPYDPDERIKFAGEGVGLANLKSRLALIYNRTDLLKISDSQNIFTVNLAIPLDEKI